MHLKRIVKPATHIPELDKPKTQDPLISDISVDSLIGDGLLALHREIKNILALGVHGKLEPNDARDLRDHVKLLFEIKDRENDLLKNLTNEELEALLIKIRDSHGSK